MILTVKHRFSLYRRFEVDIWGLGLTAPIANFWGYKRNKFIRFFYKLFLQRINSTTSFRKKGQPYIYRIDQHFFQRKRRSQNIRFISVRLTRLYFITLRDYHFRQYFKKASKLSGNTEMHYLRFLEGRLSSIIYRTNYNNNIFTIMRLIKEGNFFINFKKVSFVNALVPLGAFVTIKSSLKKRFNKELCARLKYKSVLFNIPSFLFISYRCFFFFLIRYPQLKELIFPFELDLYRLSGYY